MNIRTATRRVAAAGATAAIAAGLIGVGTASASAITLTDFCFDNLHAHTQSSSHLPSKALYCQMQAGPARAFGYTGPIDGVMGKSSWVAVQKYLKADWRLVPGDASGKPGRHTYAAIQRAANASDFYSTPVRVDGSMALKDWQGWAHRLKLDFYSD